MILLRSNSRVLSRASVFKLSPSIRICSTYSKNRFLPTFPPISYFLDFPRMTGVEAVPENIDFPKTEAKILKFWKEIDAFQTSLKQSKGKPQYTFYDGPPFATGKPHYGHLLAGTIKVILSFLSRGVGLQRK